MASLKDKQQEAMASIDTAKAMIDKVLTLFGIMEFSPSLSLTFATNPIGYLMQMLEHLGVTYDEIRDFLTNFLIWVLPSLEISAKTVLLTNLQNMVSCSVDPRIPEKYRKLHKQGNDYNTSQEHGIDIDIETIDFLNKLSISPLSDEGRNMYFGLNGVTDVYKFARAEDFDAFLWFVIHKGHFPNSTDFNNIDDMIDGIGATISPSDGTLLDVLTVTPTGEGNTSHILNGNTFKDGNSGHVISMCIDTAYNKDNGIISNTLVPISDDWNSVNWYSKGTSGVAYNLGLSDDTTRDYSKENGICNIQYIDQASNSQIKLNGLVNNKLRFTILPRPYVHVPDIVNGEPVWRFVKLLFDSKGNYDTNGKYTIPLTTEEVPFSGFDPITHHTIVSGVTFGNVGVRLTFDSGNVEVTDKSALLGNLIECYKGLTVYEFNYDYVMSLKLFDAKSIATALLDSVINARLGLNIGLSNSNSVATEEVKEIVKNIVYSDGSSVSDCFFEFSNKRYDALLKRTEQKRLNRSSIDSIKKILEAYDNATTFNEQVNVLNRAITQATVSITDGADAVDANKLRMDFVTDLVEQLTQSIVLALLSPKVMMILEVNETIMGGKWKKFTMSDLIKAMRQVIISLVNEIRDLIVQELLKLVMKLLTPILNTIESVILREQIENYTDAIQDILRNCPMIWFKFGRQTEGTKLDTVDYADIDASTNNNDQPLNNC